ncbi:hypothetical protein O2N63_13960 [Aliiroseovarius sp. KMU-50]|uniref:DUF8173 domain-containing protein n=1 Tax=Aliiroseovarius salicola TaxID=3009082 RepID=A0ABT4W3U6_9RHOB|nr:hypothetical protein [Aliiroseovarius sp. KMU-50]MDA5095188.1 hypothetical protein [Aliiroseovarius sp. KMU-50]
MFRPLLISLLTLAALPVSAQEVYRFGDDAYMAGDNVTLSGDAVDDAFIAGNTVVISAPVEGSAHAGGRSVSVSGPVGNNVYAAGMNVNLAASVGGDAQLAGDTVLVAAPVSGDLRVAAQRVEITGSVGDSALVAAENILLTEVIAGDASFATDNISFGANARIDGTLYLYAEDVDAIDVPDHVVSADRIERLAADEFDGSASPEGGATRAPESNGGFLSWLGGKIGAILTLTVVASVVAYFAPGFLMGLRDRTLESPFRAIWMGFLSISALAGALFVLGATGYGILLAPFAILGAVLLGIAGYVIGTYLLGVGAVKLAGQPLPVTFLERAVAALVGAVSVTVLALIPVVGWPMVLAVTLAGAGALMIRWFAPGFYTEV